MFVLMWEKRNADDFLRRNAWYNFTPVDVALAHSMLPCLLRHAASPSWMQSGAFNWNSRSSAPYISSDPQRRRTHSYTWVLRCSAWSIHSSCLVCGARLSQRVLASCIWEGHRYLLRRRRAAAALRADHRSIAGGLSLPFSRLGESCCRSEILGVSPTRKEKSIKTFVLFCCVLRGRSSVVFFSLSSSLWRTLKWLFQRDFNLAMDRA